MKKLYPLIFFISLCFGLQAQHQEAAPQVDVPEPNSEVGQSRNGLLPMWDIQFGFDITDQTTLNGWAAAVHIGDEFWISRWNFPDLARVDNQGVVIEEFSIPGLSNVRAFTWGGTSIYASNNALLVYEIDPVSKTISSTIDYSAQLTENIRFLTYDPTLDGGNGGFYAANFTTDIFFLDMVGNVIGSIPQATHTLGGMYGAAVDNTSPDGPYLWVYHQPGTTTDNQISLLKMPEGTPVGVSRNVDLDFNSSGLAGGLFISDSWDPNGGLVLGGLIQDDPNILFGYTLDFTSGDAIDVGSVEITGPSSSCDLTDSETVSAVLQNDGQVDVSDFDVELYINGMLNQTDTYVGTITPGTSDLFTFSTPVDLSANGLYAMEVRTVATGDVSNVNDPAFANIVKKARGYTPVDDGFDKYEQFQTTFDELYNVGEGTWFVNLDGTASNNTGPITDLSGNGRYVYMEATGLDEGTQAVLSSNCLDMSTLTDPELIFAYHMYGADMGSLSVDLLPEGGSSANLFTVSGQVQTSDSDPWEFAFIDLSSYTTGFAEIFFTGTRGPGFTSDIALDAINITGCPVLDGNVEATIMDAGDTQMGSIEITFVGASGPFSYDWGDNFPDTSFIDNLAGGNYTVEITDSKGCSGEVTFTVPGTVNTTDLDGLGTFELLPNPTSDYAWINLSLASAKEVEVGVFNVSGQMVQNQRLGTIKEMQYYLEVDHLPQGYYLVEVNVEGQRFSQKLIVK